MPLLREKEFECVFYFCALPASWNEIGDCYIEVK